MNKMYKSQVTLVLDTLPEIAKEKTLALHGGTAINLFIRNMPRLSVDIDLTYIEISDRKSSFDDIIKSLNQIKARLNEFKPDIVTEILQVRSLLSEMDRKFLLSFKRLDPNWEVFDLEDFPAVRWKMKNLRLFKEKNEAGYNLAVKRLEDYFSLT